MNDTQKDLIFLLSCAVNRIMPDKERVQAMDPEKLYPLAKMHSVRSAVCIALKSAGIDDAQFDQAYKKAIRKTIFLDMERKAILEEFDKQGIWYMPLKGAVLKEYYPETGMREMSDNDILFDAEKRRQVREIMLAHGYTAEYYETSNQDVYQKPPVLNFEMHTALFGAQHAETLCRYYADVLHRLRRDEDGGYGYHFSDEDFYVYLTAHEWKHYTEGGTGIRSLLDCYVFCQRFSDALDWDYIRDQCHLLAIGDFEQERRQLADKIFSSGALPFLTQREQKMLLYYLAAGTHGNIDTYIAHQMNGQSRFSFWMRSIFIPRKQMEQAVPFTAKSPLLYPAGVMWRCIRILLFRRDKLDKTIKAVKKYDKSV